MRHQWQRLALQGRTWFGVLVGTSIAACGEDDDPCARRGPVLIAPATAWQLVEPRDDPFWAEYDGDPASCSAESAGIETGTTGTWFGIDTVRCGYITLEQPLEEPLCAGDTVRLQLWHFNLLDTGADYRVALTVGDEYLVDVTVPVPSGAELVERRAEIAVDVAIDGPMRFHLSNHGTNSWGLLDVVVE